MLQDERNKLLTTKNALESKLNTLQADVVVFQQRIEYLQGEEQAVNERNISLESEVKRLKNTLADGQQINKAGPEVFFGFTRTEMAQVCQILYFSNILDGLVNRTYNISIFLVQI